MICVTVLGVIALVKGIDGTVLTSIVGALAGLGGYTLGSLRKEAK